ncbi:four helix bundle protein [Maribacter sp. PR1]|uniref:Four helix bundle protein n=1 Tax=Maribacter cobaltidurans TaxID=1178778 RepID=A0ABU7ITK8_9FLAO|nr:MULTISPECIES: four helix bundle protein [Maribacter]MDC6388574.1 four helix bundle protein [Maribacter sp. PR1]MEE1975963.1 four helix bundle protein [Maribacter cobaltidurans]
MQNLKSRTQKFAVDCWHFCSKLPKSREYDAWARQLIRCSRPVGANYRASQRAKSTADFINKLKIVKEEADESVYWLELFLEVRPELEPEIIPLKKEASELLAITVASIKTAKKTDNNKQFIRYTCTSNLYPCTFKLC